MLRITETLNLHTHTHKDLVLQLFSHWCLSYIISPVSLPLKNFYTLYLNWFDEAFFFFFRPGPMACGGFPGSSAVKESACSAGDLGLIPGLGRPPGEGNNYLLEFSGLENSMGCIVHGLTRSQTQLSNVHFHGMWRLNSLTRDQTHVPCSGSAES